MEASFMRGAGGSEFAGREPEPVPPLVSPLVSSMHACLLLPSLSQSIWHISFVLPHSGNSSLTKHKVNHSKQISLFFFLAQVGVNASSSFFSKRKKGEFLFPLPNCLISDVQQCVYLKLCWLRNVDFWCEHVCTRGRTCVCFLHIYLQ